MKLLMIALVLVGLNEVSADDMHKYLQKTKKLVVEENYEEALERHLWFHDNALKHEESMYGVRLSFALSDWKSLGEKYPPALVALVETRDQKENVLRVGGGDRDLFHDVVSINRTLENEGRSIAFFEEMIREKPLKVEGFWPAMEDIVLDHKRFDIAQQFIEDVRARFSVTKKRYNEGVALSSDPRFEGSNYKSFNENNFVKQVRRLVEFSVATGDLDSAKLVREKALKVLDDRRIRELEVTEEEEAESAE